MAENETSKTTENVASSRFQPWISPKPISSKGLKISRTFSNPDEHPFDQIQWEIRQAKITDDSGEVILSSAPLAWGLDVDFCVECIATPLDGARDLAVDF